MADDDAQGHGDLDRGRLLLDPSRALDQAVFEQAIGRVTVVLGSRRPVELGEALPLVVLEERALAPRSGSPTKATPLAPASVMWQPRITSLRLRPLTKTALPPSRSSVQSSSEQCSAPSKRIAPPR